MALSGIYRLSVGSLFYIGQTGDLRQREAQHRLLLSKGKHPKPTLQRAAAQGDKISFSVVCYASRHKLLELEELEQDRYRQDPLCVNHSLMDQRARRQCRPIALDGQQFPSIKAAAEALGVSSSRVAHWLKGRTKSPYTQVCYV